MAKQPMQPVSSYFDVMSLLRVLAEPEVYLERLASLEKLRTEINEEIAREETLARLQDMTGQQKQALDVAKATLGEAQTEAARLRKEADADTKLQRENLRAGREQWKTECKRQQDELAAKYQSLEARELAARAALEKSKTDLARAEYLMREATQLADEYKGKVAALKGIVS